MRYTADAVIQTILEDFGFVFLFAPQEEVSRCGCC